MLQGALQSKVHAIHQGEKNLSGLQTSCRVRASKNHIVFGEFSTVITVVGTFFHVANLKTTLILPKKSMNNGWVFINGGFMLYQPFSLDGFLFISFLKALCWQFHKTDMKQLFNTSHTVYLITSSIQTWCINLESQMQRGQNIHQSLHTQPTH